MPSRRTFEAEANAFPHFRQRVHDDDGAVYDLHFVALFSQNPNAVPLVNFHGWPGEPA